MSLDDYDPPSAFCEATRVARKTHHCCECHNEISQGTHYVYSSGIWDGRPDGFKRCMVCDALASWLEMQDVCVTFRGLKYAIEECMFGDTVDAKRRELPPLFGLHAALLQKVVVPHGAVAE